MAVVPFSVARFTPDDVTAFNEIAQPKLSRGLWAGVFRQSGRDFDRLSVTFPGVEEPVFSFERDRQGTYHLWYHDRAGSHSIGFGDSAGECLSVWRPARVQPTRSRRVAEVG